MVDIVGDCQPKIGTSLDPSFWIVHFLDVIESVVPDRNVWSLVITLEDGCQFHFDSVARTVSNCTFRADRYDQKVLKFGGALLYSTNDVFSGVARQPFVD